MMRYLRLYASFLRFAFSKAFEFRMSYYLRIMSDVVWLTTHLMFFDILYRNVNSVGGWTRDQALFMASVFTFLDAVTLTTLLNNIWELPIAVNRGKIDYYLTRPVSSLFFLTLRDFDSASFHNMIINFFVMIYFGLHLANPVNFWQIPAFIMALLFTLVIIYCLQVLSVVSVFWTHSPTSFQGLYWSFVRFAEKPDSIYYGILRRILVTVLPFAVLASFPSRLLFENGSLKILSHMAVVALAFFLLTWVLWNWGVRRYSSASS
jgi:ABC-2 type transport system permease protein